MLWTVPTGFVAFKFAEYVARPRMEQFGNPLVLLKQSETAALPSA
jgi:hypothetical protein